VGRDVESMIRELTELAVNMVKAEKTEKIQEKANIIAEERLLDLLLPSSTRPIEGYGTTIEPSPSREEEVIDRTRGKLRQQLREGLLDDRYVELEVKEKTVPFGVISNVGLEELEINLKEMLGGMFPGKKKRRRVKVPEALRIIAQEEVQKMIDMDEVVREAIQRVEQSGIIFIDEIDKIAGREVHGPDVSREGVQRDLLPIVEGSSVTTKYGVVKTDHILFIAAGHSMYRNPRTLSLKCRAGSP